ncbi:MAG: Wzz/FepE/Etk N-terminal domain-containing protein [Thermodesulfobacteriota bacterium]|nr:Wzz/FepE/Etk N-terminal domain-containing protein [Thermodesulfobacteriota bacterium]
MEEEKERLGYYEDEIDLSEILSVLWGRKWLIAGICVIAVLLAAGWSISNAHSKTTTFIGLNFSGIEKHKNPDGSQFDMHDIIRPEVLTNAATVIEDNELREIFINKPRGFVSINPFIPAEIKEKMAAMERENKTYIYLPTQFYLNFTQSHPKGAFSPEERGEILLSVISTYKDKFAEQYVKQPLLAISPLDKPLSNHDYLDTIGILNSSLGNYASFLEDRIKEAGYYRSPKTGKSFIDIKESLETIKDIDLKKIDSIVTISHLTRQKDNLIQKYQYRIKELERQRRKKDAEARIAQKLLQDAWQRREKEIPLNTQQGTGPPSSVLLDSSIIEKLSEKDYIAFLLKRALDADVAAKNLGVDKEYLEEMLAAIKKTSAQGENPGVHIEYVEKSLEEIRNQIVTLANNANDLNIEYLQNKYSSAIQILQSPYSYIDYSKNPRLLVVLSLIAGLILAIFIAFFLEWLTTARNKRDQGHNP